MLNKYQAFLFKKIRDTITEWSKFEYVLENDLYKFLHSLVGTAGTVGLPDISNFIKEMIEDVDEHSTRKWSDREWQVYTNPLLEIIETVEKSSHDDNVVDSNEMPVNHPETGFILLIDDDHDFVVYLKEILEKEGYIVNIALTAQKGLELYYQLKPDWIAINSHLPDPGGTELVKQIVNTAKKDNTPTAIVSGEDSKENRLLAYRIGALDFISKPIDPEVLTAYLQNRLSYKKELDNSIILDEGTGAFNRKYFNKILPNIVSTYKLDQQPFCLVMADLDHFKQINDTHGHLKGDEVLQIFVKIAQQIIKETDLLFRYGGEEFVFILPNTSGELARKRIQYIRDALAQHRFESAKGNFQVTFSSGVIQASPASIHPEEMIGKADRALYNAKQNGRNKTIVYTDSLQDKKQQLHIIIIDDVYIVRDVLLTQFNDWVPESKTPVKISTFKDGVSFLQTEWYNAQDQYVILLDGMLPHMDGIEVLKEIRKRYAGHNVIVTMLTARGKEFDVLNAMEYGADDYIVKPFQAADVMARIQTLIRKRFNG